MTAPDDRTPGDGEGEPDYWPSALGPARPVLPFVLGCAPFVAVVAFLASYHGGKEPLEALAFAGATLAASLVATVLVAAFSATVFVLFHPRYPVWKKALLFLAWRLPLIALAAAWYWVGFKREWFGTFSLAWPPVDGVYGAWVTLSDLAAGFTVIPLGFGVYHRHWIQEHYCKADPRTLGLFRIVLGGLLTGDSLRHWYEARVFYANSGVLTNHFLLFKPFSGHNFTLWNAFSTLPEVHVVFALATLCYFLYMIGYRTRLFAILSLLFVTSQDNRLVLVENGGYVVVNLLTAWAAFMPTGRRFSVDALLRSYREHKERTWSDLNDRFRPADRYEQHESAIYLLATVNIAIVYFFNVVNKSGHIWRTGLTVHYVLHLDRMVTGIAVFFREWMPLWLTRGLSWTVLAVEALICTWILSPAGRRYTRPLAMAFMHALHGAFGIMFRLGPFSWFMIGWSYLLPRPENWADLEAWYRRKARAATVVLDRTSPLAFAVGRLLARLDGLDLLTFEPSAEEDESPPLLAVRTGDGRVLLGGEAWRAAAQALPGGRFFRVILGVLSLGLLGVFIRVLSSRRRGIARFFGLGLSAKGPVEEPVRSAVRERLASWRVTARETLIAYLAVCAFFQVMIENKCFPPQLKPKVPPYMAATVGYPRMFQGWGMFAANPITDDGSLSVDAVTIDGRHVDPFTGEAPDLDLLDARGLGLGQIRQDYFNRIRLDRNKVYRDGLKDYLMRWHKETGNPNDELVAFDVYWLRDQCPRPGEGKPYNHERLAILSWRKPGYRPPPGQPPIPPPPRIVSAEGKTPESLTEHKDPRGRKPDPDDDDDTPPMEKRGSGDVGK